MKCPLCNGSGITEPQQKRTAEEKRKLAVKMRGLGFSFREIMNALGYKSPNSLNVARERGEVKNEYFDEIDNGE